MMKTAKIFALLAIFLLLPTLISCTEKNDSEETLPETSAQTAPKETRPGLLDGHTHVFTEWRGDHFTHYKVCSCGETTATEEHMQSNQHCTVCQRKLSLGDGVLAYPINQTTCRIVDIGNVHGQPTLQLPDEIEGFTVTEITEKAFFDCRELVSVTLPARLEIIEPFAFLDCVNLETLILPDTLVSIGQGAFANCEKLTSLHLSSTVTEISPDAFTLCRALNFTVDEDNGVYALTDGCLIEKESGTLLFAQSDFVLPKDGQITAISPYAFSSSANSARIALPGTIRTLPDSAFLFCTASEIVLPDSLTQIGASCFSQCTNLKTLTLPKSLTSIGTSLFAYCEKLQTVRFEGTLAQWQAVEKADGWNACPSGFTVVCSDGREVFN